MSRVPSLIVMLSALIALAISLSAMAGFTNGNQLWEELRAAQRIEERKATLDDGYPAARGMGYVTGVIDAVGRSFCIPSNATAGQLKDVVFDWLRDHPEKRHLQAELLIREALAEKFSCK